jgi:hypothetical protein
VRKNITARALTAPVVGLVLGSLLLTGCAKAHPAASDQPAPSTPATTTAPPTSAPPSPTRTKKPKPTKKPTRTAGSGGAGGTDEPATAGGGICSDLDASEMGAVLAVTVTGSAIPGGGCEFDPHTDGDPSATVVETSFAATPGGMDGAKTNATSSVEGNPVDLTGIGDAAFVVTGTAFGGPDIEGAGAVKVGDRLVNVNVSQSTGLTRARVKALVIAVLRLAAGKLGGSG